VLRDTITAPDGRRVGTHTNGTAYDEALTREYRHKTDIVHSGAEFCYAIRVI
jgi:hypothetical protein